MSSCSRPWFNKLPLASFPLHFLQQPAMMKQLKKQYQRIGTIYIHLSKLELVDCLSLVTGENLREDYDEQRIPVVVAKMRELIAEATDSGFFEAKTKEESRGSDLVAEAEEECNSSKSDPVANEEEES